MAILNIIISMLLLISYFPEQRRDSAYHDPSRRKWETFNIGLAVLEPNIKSSF